MCPYLFDMRIYGIHFNYNNIVSYIPSVGLADMFYLVIIGLEWTV